MRYTITVSFETDRKLTDSELGTLNYSAELLALEPVGDDGDHAEWGAVGGSVRVNVVEGVGR